MSTRKIPDYIGGDRVIDDAQVPATYRTLLDKAPTAFSNNQTYLALGTPTNAQVAQQVQSLTRQVNALFKLLVDPSDTTGT